MAAIGHRRGGRASRHRGSRAHPRPRRSARRAALASAAAIEIGGHGDHGVDAFGHSQRAQVRRASRRATLRAADSLRPSSRQWLSDTSSGRPRAAASAARTEARLARRGLDRQRLVREQLAIACDGQRVVVEVKAVHGQCQVVRYWWGNSRWSRRCIAGRAAVLPGRCLRRDPCRPLHRLPRLGVCRVAGVPLARRRVSGVPPGVAGSPPRRASPVLLRAPRAAPAGGSRQRGGLRRGPDAQRCVEQGRGRGHRGDRGHARSRTG